MKERPILFSAESVRAILDGRKTMTRRVVNPQPDDPRGAQWATEVYPWEEGITVYAPGEFGVYCTGYPTLGRTELSRVLRCPYGVPGDRLWVKEGYYRPTDFLLPAGGNWKRGGRASVRYTADDHVAWHDITHDEYRQITEQKPGRHTGLHLHKCLCRLWLEVVNVRVERVQDISEVDAQAEGVSVPDAIDGCPKGTWVRDSIVIDRFARLWDSLNAKRDRMEGDTGSWPADYGPYCWDANPLVWVVEFKRIEASKAEAAE